MRNMFQWIGVSLSLAVLVQSAQGVEAVDVKQLVTRVQGVGPMGVGSREAVHAASLGEQIPDQHHGSINRLQRRREGNTP